MPDTARRTIRGTLGVSLLAVALIAFAAVPSLAADFIGSESCRTCHPDAYAAWVDSPHARGFTRLSSDERNNPQCLQCHGRDVSSGGEPGVSCETCHGAGEHYWPSYVMRDGELARAVGLVVPDTKSCLSCHDGSSPSLLPFNVDEAMKAIDHWSAEREARKARGKRSQAPSKNDDLLWKLVRLTKPSPATAARGGATTSASTSSSASTASSASTSTTSSRTPPPASAS